MRWALVGGGLFLVLIGLVWILQGLNVLAGSVMSGRPVFSWLGLVVGLGGSVLTYLGARRGPRR